MLITMTFDEVCFINDDADNDRDLIDVALCNLESIDVDVLFAFH